MHIKLEMYSYKMNNYSPEDMLGQGRKPKRAREEEGTKPTKPPSEMSRPIKVNRLKEMVQIHKLGTDPPK
ncbi:hypothetical protein QJS04_geneDACA017773 [Acorus gramineus]|uniref:Uncharacterized protein n=1 Tax=Acorus gramineus TaxID=55184 RepID=A0AAV9BUN2_ACOGR|nr:hypothetical protein QJS04_geneDACA017773 [Acorus gramineus]